MLTALTIYARVVRTRISIKAVEKIGSRCTEAVRTGIAERAWITVGAAYEIICEYTGAIRTAEVIGAQITVIAIHRTSTAYAATSFAEVV